MDQVITVGMVVKPMLGIVGMCLALGVVVWLFSIFASGFNR